MTLSTHHQKALDDAKEMLDNIDPDEFLETFIKLNQEATDAGIPSVDDFIKSFGLNDHLMTD